MTRGESPKRSPRETAPLISISAPTNRRSRPPPSCSDIVIAHLSGGKMAHQDNRSVADPLSGFRPPGVRAKLWLPGATRQNQAEPGRTGDADEYASARVDRPQQTVRRL